MDPRPLAPVALVLLVVLAGCAIGGAGSTPTGSQLQQATASATATNGSGGPSPTGAANGTADGAGTPTPRLSPTRSPTANIVSESGIRVVEIHEDAEGRDVNNLNDEYIVLENTGEAPIDLSGWSVKDEDEHVHTFKDGVTLEIGETITLHTGQGTQTESHRFWWSEVPVWDNNGDTISIHDDGGHQVYERSYD